MSSDGGYAARPFSLPCLLRLTLLVAAAVAPTRANPDAKRLYDDLLSDYNRLIRPVSNSTERVTVKLGLRLSQLMDLVSSVCSGNDAGVTLAERR